MALQSVSFPIDCFPLLFLLCVFSFDPVLFLLKIVCRRLSSGMSTGKRLFLEPNHNWGTLRSWVNSDNAGGLAISRLEGIASTRRLEAIAIRLEAIATTIWREAFCVERRPLRSSLFLSFLLFSLDGPCSFFSLRVLSLCAVFAKVPHILQ